MKQKRAHVFLDTCHLDNPLIDCSSCYETIHGDLSSLAQAMSTIHGLRVVGGVPVALIEDDSVRSRQVDAEATSARAEQETEIVISVNASISEFRNWEKMGTTNFVCQSITISRRSSKRVSPSKRR